MECKWALTAVLALTGAELIDTLWNVNMECQGIFRER